MKFSIFDAEKNLCILLHGQIFVMGENDYLEKKKWILNLLQYCKFEA